MTKTPPPVIPATFEDYMVNISLDRIIAIKQLSASVRLSRKFDQIVSTVESEGLIEPPVVARCKDESEQFPLLDGHARIEVLKSLGKVSVACLVATDDEAFTYNKRLCRLATIQEHKMILKLVEHGMPEEFGRCRRSTVNSAVGPCGAVGGHPGCAKPRGIAPDKLQMVDSTVIRAHHHAVGAKEDSERGSWPFKRVGSRPRSTSASTAQASR